ncbi:MAG: hypothetical protein Q8O84_00135 [Nanoarchaeota archaeon]|nr:hypothetical protein [Nanoarchaeota archaeon]
MTLNIKEPELIGKVQNYDLESIIEQNFKILFKSKKEKLKIYIKYQRKKEGRFDERCLEVSIPQINTSMDTGRGIYAKFVKSGFNKSMEIKGMNNYFHNEKLAKIFTNKIQPILKETLPRYMYKLTEIPKLK